MSATTTTTNNTNLTDLEAALMKRLLGLTEQQQQQQSKKTDDKALSLDELFMLVSGVVEASTNSIANADENWTTAVTRSLINNFRKIDSGKTFFGIPVGLVAMILAGLDHGQSQMKAAKEKAVANVLETLNKTAEESVNAMADSLSFTLDNASMSLVNIGKAADELKKAGAQDPQATTGGVIFAGVSQVPAAIVDVEL